MLFAGELHSHEYSLGPDPLGPLKGRGIPTCAAISATQMADKPQFVLCGLCLPTALYIYQHKHHSALTVLYAEA